MFGRKQLAAFAAEFLGTGALALVVLTVQHSTIGLPYFVALAAGLTLAAMTVVFGSASGAQLNPAVTIGLWTTRQVKTVAALCNIVGQLLGAWAAYHLYVYFAHNGLQSVGAHYDSHVLVAEAVGAFILSLAWAAAVFNGFASSKKAFAVGSAFMLGMVVASSASFGLVNPALALSDRAIDVLGSAGWTTYALGPVLGAVIGINLYALIFAPESSFLNVAGAVGRRVRAANAAAKEVAPDDKASVTSKSIASKKKPARSTRGARRK